MIELLERVPTERQTPLGAKTTAESEGKAQRKLPHESYRNDGRLQPAAAKTRLLNGHQYRSADDGQLIDWALVGDRAAFTELVRRYQPRLYSSALKLTKCPEIAEDIVQESWLSAYSKLHSFRGESAFYSWLFRIAFNQFLASRRRRRLPTLFFDEIDCFRESEPADTLAPADVQLERLEDRSQVRNALKQLDPPSRQILEMREMQGYSYQQISQFLQIKLGTVRSRLSRAKDKLQRLLQKQEDSFSHPQ